MNDLWDTLPTHARYDIVGLVYEACRTNLVAVNTAVGQNKRVNIPAIAQQGGTWGPMMCSNSSYVLVKHCKEKKEFYSYKNMVNIIPLAMVDDLLTVSRCGMDSIRLNVTINSIIELKKLKFHTTEDKKRGKCHVMHIGSNEKNCPWMKVH